ncbi:hypothetical protein ACWDRB_47480 [Nonomuraea sp. NPDC003707]
MTYVKVEQQEQPAELDDEVTVEEHVPVPAPAEEPEPITDDGAISPAFAPGRTLLVGGLATATLLVTGLYQLAGVGGLVGGGAAVAGAGVAYVAHRRGGLFRNQRGRVRSGGAGGDASGSGSTRKARRAARSSGADATHRTPAGGGRRSRRGSGDGGPLRNFRYRKPHSRRETSGNGTSAENRHGWRGGRERFPRTRQTVRAWANRRTGRLWDGRRRLWTGVTRVAGHLSAWDATTRIGLYALFTRLIARARRLLDKTPAPDAEAPTAQPEDAPTGQPATPNPTQQMRSPRMTHVTYAATGENPLVLMSVEMLNAASLYDVPKMMTVAEHLDAMYQVPENIALAFTRIGQRLQAAHPIHQVVVQDFAEVVKGMAAVIPAARQLAVTFRGAHADDIARHDAPRVNEHKWDINA